MSFSSQRHTINAENAAIKRQRQRREKPSTDAAIADGASNHALSRALGSAPLDPRVRAEMEARFGENFAAVRIHNDADANCGAAELDAKAYTVGNDIAFSAERYAPHTAEGKRLLAHELAHVVQQRRGGPHPELNPHASHETAADLAAVAVTQGTGSVNVAGATGVGVAREPEDDKKKRDDRSGSPPPLYGPNCRSQRRRQR